MNHAERRKSRPRRPKIYDVHHRHPRGRNGSNAEHNKIRVLRSLHEAYHRLFADMMPHEVAKTLNDTWISVEWELVAVRRSPE